MAITQEQESGTEWLYELAEKQPLCHPGVSSIVLHDYEYPPPAHLRNIYGKIYRALMSQQYENEQPKKLGFFLPREHGKSEAAAVVTPSWYALQNPNTRTLIISETTGQARKKLQQCRNVIAQYAYVFGRSIKKETQSELILERSVNHAEPTIEAAGMGKSITGGHYDLIIFDDILSWDNQRTEGQRDKTEQRFKDYMNLGSEGDSTFVIIGTRKHPKDLYGGLINNPVWDTTVEKAIEDWSVIENREYGLKIRKDKNVENLDHRDRHYNIEANELKSIDTENETIVDVLPYRNVEVLWPERWSLDNLIQDMLSTMLDDDQSPLVWQREKQNDPTVMQGQVLDIDMLHYVEELEYEKEHYSWYAGLDPAVVEDPEQAAMQDSDYWALAIIAHDSVNDNTYLDNIIRKRGMSLKKGIDWVIAQLANYEITNVLVESNQAQRWFVQTAKDKGLRVQETSSSGSKEERIISLSTRFETGKIKIVAEEGESQKWQSFETEWAQFPSGDHDDRLDATEIAYRNTEGNEIKNSKHGTEVFR